MRYPASEKAEIIELVEQSHLPAKRTLDKLGVPRATFYRSYDRYREGEPEALADAIEPLIGSPERRRALGEAGRRRFEAEFTDAAMRNRLLDQLERLADRSR